MLFVIQHAAVLALLVVMAAATGTAVAGQRLSLALRSALGLAVAGQIFVLLGTIGALRSWTLCLFVAIAIAGGVARMEKLAIRWRPMGLVTLATAPLFVLALYPPIAFDETLYHLPTVRAVAGSGAISFLPDLRNPVYPQLHELLCVPVFMLSGDVATHLVAVIELLLLAAILIEWPQQRNAGFLAAALVVGSPIVISLAAITYVDIALTLFVTAGFYCLERAVAKEQSWYFTAAGFFLGTACSVKYLGWYFAVAGLAYVLMFAANRRRPVMLFLAAGIAAAGPMCARIITLSGSPVFPFMSKIFGQTPWTIEVQANASPVRAALRLFWDITFDRARMNQQPPYSPLFGIALLITIIVAMKGNRRAAFLSVACAGYIAIFGFLPQDSRYLLSLLPLVSVVASSACARWEKVTMAVALMSIGVGIAYAGYRLVLQGPPPLNEDQRRRHLEERVPEYRALEQRGPGRIYVCGAEQLKYYGGDDLLGDVVGLLSTGRIVGSSRNAAELSASLTRLDVRYLLMSRRGCRPEWQRLPAAPQFERIYADAGAVLWRVREPSGTESR